MKALEVHRGSAKNTKVYERPTKATPGVGGVEFLPYISLFDYGQFKNSPIPLKDVSMKFQTIKNFDLLNNAGIYNHYRGLNEKGEMLIDLVRIPEPYTNVPMDSVNYLLPIEIVFREYTHPASSDLKVILKGKKTWQELGYEEMPAPNKRLPHVKIGYQTKLEDEDRTLTRNEAQKLAGLTNEDMDELEDIAHSVNNITTNHAAGIGLKHYDGKIEAAKDPKGRLMVIDAAGTLDEDRFMAHLGNGIYVDVSKQFFRNFYTTNGFKAQADAAKDRAERGNVRDWTTFCPQPPPMPALITDLGSRMYVATALEWAPEYKYAILEGINTGQTKEDKIDSSDLDLVPPLSSVAKDLYVAERIHEALRATGRNFDDIYEVIRANPRNMF